MITIFERQRRMASGVTSLFASFPYDKRLVDVAKSADVHIYHKDTHEWEFPITELAGLIDKFVLYDDVRLVPLADSEEKEDEPLMSTFKTEPRDYQLDAIRYGLSHPKFLLLDEPGLGKAVTLDTPVLTKSGFIPMEKVKVGDTLYDDQGKECKVLATYDHDSLNMYRLTFTDGSFVDCCEDHLWSFSYNKCVHRNDDRRTTTVARVNVTKNTKWIAEHNWKRCRIVFPRCKPVEFEKKSLPLHPYVLGCLLGDGGFSVGSATLTSADSELVERVNGFLPESYYCRKQNNKYGYTITSHDGRAGKENKIIRILNDLGLLYHFSYEKFIPEAYKYSSIEDRIELLRGLFDTDGSAGKDNILQFYTTSMQLANDVKFLVESLGGLVNINLKKGKYKRDGKLIETRICYNLTIRIDDPSQLVTLARKRERLGKRKFLPRRMLKSIESIGKKPGKCITVDSPNSLYLIKDFIVTHNTLEIICMAEELRLREGLEHCLVICGLASLRMNWLKEIEKHSNLNGTVLGARINRNGNLVWDSIQKRVGRLMSPIDEFFVIVNIETIRDEGIVNAICNGPNKFGFIAIDEGHCCKSWKSIQGNNVLSLEAPHKVIATGTPLLNSPLDTYMMLTWIGMESKKGITKFKETYCVQVPVINNGKPHPFRKRIIGYKNLDLLKQVLDSCSIRRTKDILNLPEKTIIDEVLVMDPAQEQFYRKLRDSIKKESRQEGIDACDKIKLKPQLVRSYIARLRQATSCPQLLTSQEISSIKVDRAIELAREIVQNGSKVVILSQFKEPVAQLMEALKDLNPLLGTGDVPEGEFSANVDLFQEDNEHMAFIGTCSKCGTGLTLNKASYMIFIDQPWTWGEYQQCTDRIHRIGTKRPVFVYNLICRDTIDEAVSLVINRKRSLSDFVVDDVDNGETLEAIRRYVLDE